MKSKVWISLCIGFFLAQGAWRISQQKKSGHVVTRQGQKLLKLYDLRGYDLVSDLLVKRESDQFKNQMWSNLDKPFYWPGLKSVQTSWAWMQILNGLHTQSSHEGDYSWLFSKLYFLSESLDQSRDHRVVSLAPFFLVIGTDGIGATLLVNRWTGTQSTGGWKTWFYAGFHALENLKNSKLAADYFRQALKFRGAPDHLAALVLRLEHGEISTDKKNRGLLLRDLDSSLQERIRRVRPDWFE